MNANNSDNEVNVPRSLRKHVSVEVKRILNESYVKNPYPDEIELQKLTEQCGIERYRVYQWFKNKRYIVKNAKNK